MSALPEVRRAEPEDARAIVECIRSGFDPTLLDLFIYGSSGIASCVEELIRVARSSPVADTHHWVAARDQQLIGCIELRRLPDALFLNYVSVLAQFRREGIATQLLRKALSAIGNEGPKRMRLDVLDHNTAAVSWYEKLSFEASGVVDWWTFAFNDWSAAVAGGDGTADGCVSGLAQARVTHRCFGFSQVRVSTTTQTYDVGLLGSAWYRLTTAEALQDPELARTLLRLEDRQNLLAILRSGDLPPQLADIALRKARTRRLEADLSVVKQRLGTPP